MDWSLAETYYVVASLTNPIAVGISIALYLRSRPDRLKAKISEAVAPFERRLGEVERGQTDLERKQDEAAKRHDASVRALDHDVSTRIKELIAESTRQHRENNATLAEQGRALARIAAQLEHGVTRRDIDTLHHRVTETAKAAAASNGVLDGLATMVHNIEDFLRESGRG
jgi:hypothetical protein